MSTLILHMHYVDLFKCHHLLYIINCSKERVIPMPSPKVDAKYRQQLRMMGLNLAYYRKLRDLTQEELAEKASISRTRIADFEITASYTGLSLGTIFKLADALDIPVKKLFDFRDED